jgi:transcriptional regulator with XRE-family HTH domain
VAFA